MRLPARRPPRSWPVANLQGESPPPLAVCDVSSAILQAMIANMVLIFLLVVLVMAGVAVLAENVL